MTYLVEEVDVGNPVVRANSFLGESSSRAYRGDRGKVAYDHSQSLGNPHGLAWADITGVLPLPQLPTQVIRNDQTYSNPAWITALDGGKITGLGLSAAPLLTNYNILFAGNTTNTFGGNLAGGVFALKSAIAVNDSTVWGNQANEFTTNGVGYCSFGRYAGQYNLTGTNTSTFGDSAGRFATGQQNSMYGYATGEYSGGSYCSYFGNGTGQGFGGSGAHGDLQTMFGYAVQPGGLGSTRCAIFGSYGKYLGSGSDDTGVGHMVLYNSIGGENTAGGVYAGFTNTTGLRNTWFGESAGNDAVNQVPNLIGSIGFGSRCFTTRNYQAVLGGTTIVETYLRGKVAINGTQSVLPRAQLDVVGSSGNTLIGASNSDAGFRVWTSPAGAHVEAMDSTLIATYSPLNLRGSAVNISGPANFNDFINLPSSNRIFQTAGSMYLESNGNFWMRNFAGTPLLLLAADGRLFPANDQWITSLYDGVPRLRFVGNSATEFNGAYSLLSHDRAHGLYTDGSIRWGQDQTNNSRGSLTWDANKAVVFAPLNLDLSCSGSIGFTATASVFSHPITSVFQSLASDPTGADLSSGQTRTIKNTSTGTTKVWLNDGGTFKSITFV